MSNAVHAYGTVLQLSNAASPAVYTPIAEIRSIDGMGGERDAIEVTHMESPQACKEYIAGLIDSVAVTLDLNYIVQDATHKDMLSNLQETTVANIFRPYRICFPDFGASSFTGTVSSGTWTTSTHSWNTAQPVVFSTTGTLPTMSPVLVPGRIYWARRASATTFKIYPTSADALADTNQITGGTGGSGTHTVKGGSILSFTGMFKSAKVSGPVADRLSISTSIKVTGVVTLTP